MVEGVKIPLLFFKSVVTLFRPQEKTKRARVILLLLIIIIIIIITMGVVAFSQTTRRDESIFMSTHTPRGKGSWRFLSPFSVF